MIRKPDERMTGVYAGTWLADEAGTQSLRLYTGGRGEDAFLLVENPTTGEQRVVTMGALISHATADGVLVEPEAPTPDPDPADVLAAHASVAESDLVPPNPENAAREGAPALAANGDYVVGLRDPAPNVVEGAAVLQATTESSTPASKRKTPKKGAAT